MHFLCGMYVNSTRFFFFFSSRRRHTRLQGDWSSDVCSSDLLHDLRERLHGRPRDVLRSEHRRPFFQRAGAERRAERSDLTTPRRLVRELLPLELREAEDPDETGPELRLDGCDGDPTTVLRLVHVVECPLSRDEGLARDGDLARPEVPGKIEDHQGDRGVENRDVHELALSRRVPPPERGEDRERRVEGGGEVRDRDPGDYGTP